LSTDKSALVVMLGIEEFRYFREEEAVQTSESEDFRMAVMKNLTMTSW
jgi:hypothetical protein